MTVGIFFCALIFGSFSCAYGMKTPKIVFPKWVPEQQAHHCESFVARIRREPICSYCQTMREELSERITHFLSHMACMEGKVACKRCPTSFPLEWHLALHTMFAHQRTVLTELDAPRNMSSLMHCYICNMLIPHTNEETHNIESHYARMGGNYPCSSCSDRFPRPYHAHTHKLMRHPEMVKTHYEPSLVIAADSYLGKHIVALIRTHKKRKHEELQQCKTSLDPIFDPKNILPLPYIPMEPIKEKNISVSQTDIDSFMNLPALSLPSTAMPDIIPAASQEEIEALNKIVDNFFAK